MRQHGVFLFLQERSQFTYLRPSHSSVLGIREYALEAGGSVAVLDEAEARIRGWAAIPRSALNDQLVPRAWAIEMSVQLAVSEGRAADDLTSCQM